MRSACAEQTDALERVVSGRATRDLARLPRGDREEVIQALRRLAGDPGGSDLTKLAGRRGEWRLRAGRWRVLLVLDNTAGTMTVTRVLARKEAY